MDSLRKWLNKPKADDKSLLARFYHADRALSAVANELDSFDGRSEPERCSRLVSKLRQEQDRVLGIINQIMDELLGEDRACRAFRAKFPEEVLQESLAGQLWFGAECLSAGSAILNREVESAEMRPLAKAVTKSLDNVRNLLRDQCLRNNTPNSPHLKLDINDSNTENLYESLKIFDRLFAEFELLYVSAMVQVKTKQEHEIQQLICVLFSETLQRALKSGILEQEQVDSYDPSLMFSIPRLAIINGLIIFNKGPLNMDQNSDHLSEMFRPFRKLLVKMRDYLRTLNKNELFQLEKLLCTNEEINLAQSLSNNSHTNSTTTADENMVQCCDEDAKKVTVIVPSCEKNENDQNFYSIKSDSNGGDNNSEWVSEENSVVREEVNDEADNDENEEEDDKSENFEDEHLVTADCATGFLVPNTTLGNLLQSNAAPLTYNIIISEPNATSVNDEEEGEEEGEEKLTDTNSANRDSGMSTGIDQSPEQETSTNVLVGQYDENWENLRKIVEPSSSRSSSHKQHKEKHGKHRKSRKLHQSSSSDDTSISSSASSSTASSPTSSTASTSSADILESAMTTKDISRRAKFKSTENLLHRLFVCIAGVADQLQTNFAADLRQILRAVFLMNCTQEEETPPAIINIKKSKDNPQDLFEFRASEENVIRQSNSNQGSIGSQQSICSAEEVNPESSSDDAVFEEDEDEEDLHQPTARTHRSRTISNRDDNEISRSRKRHYGNRLSGRSISLSDDASTANNDHHRDSSPSTSHDPNSILTESPPKWIPDNAAPRCMSCESQFTAFRRRHHCRCCGRVFCGVCSATATPLPRFGIVKPVRVCRMCYTREATA